MRADVDGEIVGAVFTIANFRVKSAMGHGPVTESFQGTISVLSDGVHVSEPIKSPSGDSDSIQERLRLAIDTCTGPETDQRGFIRKRMVPIGCPALGRLAVRNPIINEQLRETLSRELL